MKSMTQIPPGFYIELAQVEAKREQLTQRFASIEAGLLSASQPMNQAQRAAYQQMKAALELLHNGYGLRGLADTEAAGSWEHLHDQLEEHNARVDSFLAPMDEALAQAGISVEELSPQLAAQRQARRAMLEALREPEAGMSQLAWARKIALPQLEAALDAYEAAA